MIIHRMCVAALFGGALAVAVALAGCDISGLDEATDDFDLILRFDEIATTVSVQAVDLVTLEAIPGVELTFGGPAAGEVIDVYSDPLSRVVPGDGLATFGIRNGGNPTSSNPVMFIVAAEAEGYLDEIHSVELRRAGGHSVVIEMMPAGIGTTVPGTAAASGTGQIAGEGLDDALLVGTSIGPDVRASVTAAFEAGTRPIDADGEPLTGALTAAVRVFDLDEGLAAAPEQYMAPDETVLGLAVFGMSDDQRDFAFDFEDGGDASACALALDHEVRDGDLHAAVSAGTLTEGEIVVRSVDGGRDIAVGTVPLVAGAPPAVRWTICVGGTEANVDMSAVVLAAALTPEAGGLPRRRPIVFATTATETPAGRLESVVVRNPAAAAGPRVQRIRIRGLGRIVDTYVPDAISAGGSGTVTVDLPLIPGTTVRAEARFASGETVVRTMEVPSGSFSIDLEAPATGAASYTVGVRMACAGHFLPRITADSFSGLHLAYRPVGAAIPFTDLGRVENVAVTEGRITGEVSAALIPGSSYAFRATFGTVSARDDAVAPVGSSAVVFDVDPSVVVGVDCG